MSNAPRDARAKRDWGSDDSATPILHVDMDSFFAQVEMREDPSLIGRPIVVGGTSGRGVVTSATYEARALGVRAGMPTSRARALCPTAAFIPGNHALYRHYSHQVMGILATITPALEQVSIDEAFLDVAGSRRRLGSPTHIARLIRTRIREAVGLPASVGIAATKSVAKIASSHAKPDGLLLIPKDAAVEFLHGLPVGALWGVGGRTGAILDREGIDTIGNLAISLIAPTDTGRDIARAAQSLFAREDMPIGGVRLFGVRVEGLQSRSGGVAVTLDRDEKPAASERAMDQIRSKFGASALAPATLLGTQVPARRSFGGDAAQDGQGSRSAEASARQGGDARGSGEQGTLL